MAIGNRNSSSYELMNDSVKRADPFKGLPPEARSVFDNCMDKVFGCDPAYFGFHADFTVQELIPVFMAGIELGKKLRVAEMRAKRENRVNKRVVPLKPKL